jgi:hypothetical protein
MAAHSLQSDNIPAFRVETHVLIEKFDEFPVNHFNAFMEPPSAFINENLTGRHVICAGHYYSLSFYQFILFEQDNRSGDQIYNKTRQLQIKK